MCLYLSPHFAVVQVHELVGVRAGLLLHLHGRVGELGAHHQPVVQVVGAAAPAVPRLRDLPRDRTARAELQVAGSARPRYGVANGRR